jgi:site-specific DNA-cytosine methylase
MKVLDLFCGTKSIAKAFERHGHEVYTVDWNPEFEPTLCADIGTLSAGDLIELCGGVPDVIWASPDCTSYSVAAISYHRTKNPVSGNLDAVTDYAKKCDAINSHIIEVIKELNPKYFFIENPRGGMRKMDFVKDLPRYTVTYCQYGEERMKPTDIWTNHPDPQFKPPCKNCDPCHISAPRGAQTGTQGIKGARDRARIPRELC